MTATSNEEGCPVPEGYHTVTPWIIARDSNALIAFLADAFGAEEIARVQMDDGSIGHAEMRIGDSVVMMFDAKPHWPDTPAFLRLYVAHGDAVFQQALRAGATAVTEMTFMVWGDRVGRCAIRSATSGGSRPVSRRSARGRWSAAPVNQSSSRLWIT